MEAYYYFNYLSAGWMMLEAIPLIASPTIIISILSPEVRGTTQTAFEAYLSRSLGFTLIAFAVLNLLLTGCVPLVSSFSSTAAAGPASTDVEDPTAPYAVPSLCVTLTYHVAVAFYCYTQWNFGYSTAYAIAMVMHLAFSALGSWVFLFGSTSGAISKKTGADKRTSGYPFKNVEAEKKRTGKKRL